MRGRRTLSLGCAIAVCASGVAIGAVREGSKRDAVGDGPKPTQDITSIQAFFGGKRGFYARTTFAEVPTDLDRVNLIVEFGKRDGKRCVGAASVIGRTAGEGGGAELIYRGGRTAPAERTVSPDGLVVRFQADKPADLGRRRYECATYYLRPLEATETAVNLDVAGPLFFKGFGPRAANRRAKAKAKRCARGKQKRGAGKQRKKGCKKASRKRDRKR